MSVREYRPVRVVTRQLRVTYLQTLVWFWVVVGGCWAAIATVIMFVGDADTSVWH